MGRGEKDLDPDSPFASFAGGLRALRKTAGLTLDEMAEATKYCKTVLSTAGNGDKLPTWPVTCAYVKACGGDVKEWHSRWTEAQALCKSLPNRAKDADGTHSGTA